MPPEPFDGNSPHVLLVNPWIHDFAAYDFWANPLGLLILASILRQQGARVSYIDCLDRFHPKASLKDPGARNGRGPYLKTPIPYPPGLEDIPRRFSRYGIRKEWFARDLASLSAPDLVLVTSMMTYWYPGVRETIGDIKSAFPDVPVVLGGVYATLCRDHAVKTSGADRVISGSGVDQILNLVAEYTGWSAAPVFHPEDFNTWPFPALDLQHRIPFVPLLTSLGCPFACAYCASRVLNPFPMKRDPARVVAEIRYWHDRFGVLDFAFYDDALLFDAQRHAVPLLEGIIRSGIKARFHTPNALHIREISDALAKLIKKAGFHTIRIGLETGDFSGRSGNLDRKVTQSDFVRAVSSLKKAGFQKDRIGAYLLVGLPGEAAADVEASIKLVKASGITPVPAHYTPIPHTALWTQAVKASRYDLENDPVFTNNALSPCRKEGFDWRKLSHLKKLASA